MVENFVSNKMKQAQKITACGFLHKDGKLFMAKRADTKQFLPGKYELPGGHIEHGEAMEEGLAREFQEEFNVKIKVGDPFYAFTYNRNKNGVDLHVIEVIYFVTLADDDQIIMLNPEDHSEYTWISADEVEKYLKPQEEETIAVHKGFFLQSKSKINFPRPYGRGISLLHQADLASRILAALHRDVLPDNRLVEANGRHAVAARPEAVRAPVHLVQEGEFLLQASRGVGLNDANHPADGFGRGN